MGGDLTVDPMLPGPPPPHVLRSLSIDDDEMRAIDVDEIWWNIHRTEGDHILADHILAWNALRTFGPVLRFDPHPSPKVNMCSMACGTEPQPRVLHSARPTKWTGPLTVNAAAHI